MISLNASPAQGVSSGQISACANKSTGALRIASKCAKTENPISWGKQGEVGPKGDPGARGLPGLQGPAGSSAIPNTKEITIKFLSTEANCPSFTGIPERLYAYPWFHSGIVDTKNSLSSAFNWKQLWTCPMTIKVLK